MTAEQILTEIKTAIETSDLETVQKSTDYAAIITSYATFLTDYKNNSAEVNEEIKADVRKRRPLIGRRLFEQLERDSVSVPH